MTQLSGVNCLIYLVESYFLIKRFVLKTITQIVCILSCEGFYFLNHCDLKIPILNTGFKKSDS